MASLPLLQLRVSTRRHLRPFHSSYTTLSSCCFLDERKNGEKSAKTSSTHHHGTLITRQCRFASSFWLSEVAQSFTVWGASGHLLQALHMNGTIPYWACFSLTNVLVRTSLIPLVLHSAHTAAKFAQVAPEVQFLVTIYQQDLQKQKQEGASFGEQWMLTRQAMQTLGGIYKIHDIHPLSLLKSPLAQIPVFWYFSIDLRKIINGANPELAQELTESGFLWVPDLTEADPWYGLPILAGMLLYANVEVAIGRKSLSGEATSKSKLAFYLKDFFQTIAVFMPCFMSQQPAGMQIYLCTSFLFTLGQGYVLRRDWFREFVKLPKLSAPPPEGSITKEFMQLKKLERKAQELRGNGPLLGRGVLAAGLECSFAGTNRPSTIIGTNPEGGPDPVLVEMLKEYTAAMGGNEVHTRVEQEEWTERELYGGPYIHGISASRDEMMQRQRILMDSQQEQEQNDEYMPVYSDEVMEAANRGERPIQMAPQDDDETKHATTTTTKLDAASVKRARAAKKRRGKQNKRKK